MDDKYNPFLLDEYRTLLSTLNKCLENSTFETLWSFRPSIACNQLLLLYREIKYLSEKFAVEYFIVFWNSLINWIYFIFMKMENPQLLLEKQEVMCICLFVRIASVHSALKFFFVLTIIASSDSQIIWKFMKILNCSGIEPAASGYLAHCSTTELPSTLFALCVGTRASTPVLRRTESVNPSPKPSTSRSMVSRVFSSIPYIPVKNNTKFPVKTVRNTGIPYREKRKEYQNAGGKSLYSLYRY